MNWGRHNRYNWYSISSPYFIRIKRIQKKKTKGKIYLWKIHHDSLDVVCTGQQPSVSLAKEASLAALLEIKITS